MTVSELVDVLVGEIELGNLNEDHGIVMFGEEIYTWEDHTKVDHICVDKITINHNPKGP